MMAGGVPAGATTPSQNGDCSLGKPASTTVGTFGQFRRAFGAGDGDRAQLAGLDVRQARGHRVGDHLDLAGEDGG